MPNEDTHWHFGYDGIAPYYSREDFEQKIKIIMGAPPSVEATLLMMLFDEDR